MTEGTKATITLGCSKRLSSKAATSEEARRTLRYVEPLSDVRTPLADFFSILLNRCHSAVLRYLRFDIAGSGLGSLDACGREKQNRNPDSVPGPG